MIGKLKNIIKKIIVKKEVYYETVPTNIGEILNGKVALITGGGSGIGLGIAQQFVNQNAKVVLVGRNEKKLIDAVNRIGVSNAAYVCWDANSVDDMDDKFTECVNKFGAIDILVNNAGYHGNHNFFTVTEEDFDDTFNVNVKFLFFISQKVSKYFIDNKIKGHILNISSASSMKPAWSPYEISKWSVRGFTRGLAREVAKYGIVVNGIAPGPTATSMSNWSEGDSISWSSIPLQRMVTAEEIGNMAVYLCSDYGKALIGETVFVDGGSGILTTNK